MLVHFGSGGNALPANITPWTDDIGKNINMNCCFMWIHRSPVIDIYLVFISRYSMILSFSEQP